MQTQLCIPCSRHGQELTLYTLPYPNNRHSDFFVPYRVPFFHSVSRLQKTSRTLHTGKRCMKASQKPSSPGFQCYILSPGQPVFSPTKRTPRHLRPSEAQFNILYKRWQHCIGSSHSLGIYPSQHPLKASGTPQDIHPVLHHRKLSPAELTLRAEISVFSLTYCYLNQLDLT